MVVFTFGRPSVIRLITSVKGTTDSVANHVLEQNTKLMVSEIYGGIFLAL